MMGSSNEFEITITGKGAHAALPHNGIDPVLVATHVVQALQSIITRNKKPIDSAVLSVTEIHAGACHQRDAGLGGHPRHGADVLDRRARPDRVTHARHRRAAAGGVRRQRRDDLRAQLPAHHQRSGTDAVRALGDAGHRRRGERRLPDRADDGLGGLRVHAAGAARLLRLHRQRRRRRTATPATAWDPACSTTRATTSTTS